MAKGLRVGEIRGIAIVLEWTLAIVFLIVAVSLGAAIFPIWHPEWSLALTWGAALVGAGLLIASILAHELAHALVGSALGIEVRQISLFLFGGVAHLEREPHAWHAEFWMALAGPVASLVLGVGFVVGGLALTPRSGPEAFDPIQALQAMGPLATMLLWLGPINLMLALFNLVPGFPLDGGRMLRAALWGVTGDLYRATRWAAWMGQGFGVAMMGSGMFMIAGVDMPLLGSGVASGLWIALIGRFLHRAAFMSYQMLLAQRAVEQAAPVLAAPLPRR